MAGTQFPFLPNPPTLTPHSLTPQHILQPSIPNFEFDPYLTNPHSLLPILKQCARLSLLPKPDSLHACFVKSGTILDLYVQNMVTSLYLKCGKPCQAQHLFDKMPKRSVVSWNCMIAGFADLGLWASVKSLFWLMVEETLAVPNSFAVVRMLSACGKSGDFEMGKRVHWNLLECGAGFDLQVGNALINLYAKFGDMEVARVLFDELPQRDVVSWTTLVSGYAGQGHLKEAREVFDQMPRRNVVAWNAMIAAYVLNGSFEESFLLFYKMMVLSVKPDRATLISMLSACSKCCNLGVGRALHAYIHKIKLEMTLELMNSLLAMYVKSGSKTSSKLLFNRMPTKNVISWTLMMEFHVMNSQKEAAFEIFNKKMAYKDLASWNSLINVLVKWSYFKEAFDVFYQMQNLNVEPNAATLVSILLACANTGALALGKWIHAYLNRNGVEIDGHLSCAIIDMYAKCGCLDESLEFFSKMDKKDLKCWTTKIGGLAIHGKFQLSVNAFNQMLETGIRPDGVAFLGVLTACMHVGSVEIGITLFKLMTETYNIAPTSEHCCCIVNLLAMNGRLMDAYNFVNCTKTSSSDKTAWRALLAACVSQGNVELAKIATRRLLEIEPTTSGAYVLLSNTYARARKWNDVRKIRKHMRKKGVEKVPGCSSIEIDGVVHEFFVGDMNHPCCEQIYTMLDVLKAHMRT